MLGPEAEFDIEWSSVYTFRCHKMDHFIHNKVVFVGDAAHQVSPFGARGANGCI
ncbi:FAD-dependent monooxygenase [Glaciecola sp. 33A]|jgi:3-(3-hydroxy-phenyl)propionate hydroxylase|uniref:FAD-dependent monooxygenase n=1 Tax=Glaciecola sp. 33A TaxID=2057807 RepID=UPI0035117CFA